MITEKDKAKAIAYLKRGKSIEEVSEKFDIPPKLLLEWTKDFNTKDLITIESNILASEDLIVHDLEVYDGEIPEDNKAKLKKQLEESAIEIAKHASVPVAFGDVMHAKAIQLCAQAVCGLYQTIIGDPNDIVDPSNVALSDQTLTAFKSLMKD